ncbi:MAG: AmmeMemoRadiSam system radical SAM enzyme [Planctomycetota bacterium]
MENSVPLENTLRNLTTAGELSEKLPDGRVRCLACAHRCALAEGRRGICAVRFNEKGALRVPFGYVTGLQNDPIEKKPFFHVLPGSATLSFGMLGCDFHCAFCQNWLSTQVLRDPAADAPFECVTAPTVAEVARRVGASVVTSTYNEPLITAEWAVAVFREAKKAGLRTAFVSNGHATPEALEHLRPWLDFVKVDLKSFRAERYRELGGKLEAVLDTLRRLHAMKFWVEVVTLIVPGFNDGAEELRDIAAFLASISPDIPWHVTAFHPDYRMKDRNRTPAATLLRAAETGKAEGLRFVYAGNLPGGVGHGENTACPGCRAELVERRGFHVLENRIAPDGTCPSCKTAVAGVWK